MTSLSFSFQFIGTPHWMAPEVIQESRYDGKVHILDLSAFTSLLSLFSNICAHMLVSLFVDSLPSQQNLETPGVL